MRIGVFVAAAAAIGVLGVVPAAAQGNSGSPIAFGVIAGTLGIGAEASMRVTDSIVLRLNGSYFGVDLTESANKATNGASSDYKFDVTAMFGGALIDWHPFQGGFRLSAGARYVDAQFKAHELNGRTIGNNTYTAAQIGTVHTTVSNDLKIAPYLGLGYDAAHFKGQGFNFSFGIDVGAMYAGNAEVKMTTDRSVAGLPADIAAESKSLEEKLSKYTMFYPVLMLSGKFTF